MQTNQMSKCTPVMYVHGTWPIAMTETSISGHNIENVHGWKVLSHLTLMHAEIGLSAALTDYLP